MVQIPFGLNIEFWSQIMNKQIAIQINFLWKLILNQHCDSDSYSSEIRFCIQIINRFQIRVVVKIQSRIHILNTVYDLYSVCYKYAILKIDYDPFCTSKLLCS